MKIGSRIPFELVVNTYYGHNEILRKYANVKLPYMIPGVLEHGWDCTFFYAADSKLAYFVFTANSLKEALDNGYKVEVIGSPVLYLNPTIIPEPCDKSLLLMPTHSTPEFPFANPLERFSTYIKDIQPLLKKFNPVTVCLSWYDYEQGEVQTLFKEAGLNTTMVANNRDPSFLYKLRDLMLRHSYVSSNELSTAIIYALYWKRKAFLYGTLRRRDETNWKNRHVLKAKMSKEDTEKKIGEIQNRYPELFWDNFDDKSHYWIGDSEVGLEYKKSPEELREIFDWTPFSWSKQFITMSFYKRVVCCYFPENIKRPLRKIAGKLL